MKSSLTVAQILQLAMQGRGVMSLHDIYRLASEEFLKVRRIPPLNFESEVRQTLQSFCSSSKRFSGRASLFNSHGPGRWSCKYERSDLLALL